MFLVFDTETTGLPKNYNAPFTDTENWPRCIQLAWQLHDINGDLIEAKGYLIKPEGFDIPYDSEQIHGISTELATQMGRPLLDVLKEFNTALSQSSFVVGQNLLFDINILGCEFFRLDEQTALHDKAILDTCTETTATLCELPGGKNGKFKLPTLSELHVHLFKIQFQEAHNATADVEATARCFFELLRLKIISPTISIIGNDFHQTFYVHNPSPIQPVGLTHLNLKAESEKLKGKSKTDDVKDKFNRSGFESLANTPFVHLHNHTQYSVLQSTTNLQDLITQASTYQMPAVALTDTGNMMAAFQFERLIAKHNDKVLKDRKKAEEEGKSFTKEEIKPIIGCELFVCEDLTNKKVKDNGYLMVFLAKNKNGYHNLAKLSSIAFTEGKYYVPRIDKNVLQQYKEDLIVLSGNLQGEIYSKILNIGEQQAEEALCWWKETFQDDFYLEIMRHGQENENHVNQKLIEFAKKYQIKLVATNDTYYLNKTDAQIHDIMLCIKEGEILETPIGKGRGFRQGLDNEEYYFKSGEEMKRLFSDIPQAIEATFEIANKCEAYSLAREVLLPAFDIPFEFKDFDDLLDNKNRGENNYLRHLTYEGAKKRYGELTEEIRNRLDFELATIENTGYPGYFLIVQDFCRAAREMGVSVGPGRGSAAGSAVAYCTGITNIDPIKYDLLFERFLNPDRVSMPDIDIDFDDEGRSKVITYVIDKYGSNQVAQIITYGTMAAKSSIRDAARVLNLSLSDADRIAKLVPDISLNKLFNLDDLSLKEKLKNNNDDLTKANEIKAIAQGNNLAAKVVKSAINLEGSLRNTGIHACGVIITPGDITDYVPVALAKDSEMYCTQYDNSVVEEAGLLKMDFLGLKTLTLIKDAVVFIRKRHGIELNPDDFPLDDENTYKLFQNGETVGVFQYESAGMQKYMKELKPTVFADLIAMNALYRPGPLEYIPSFIRRKHGDEAINYDLEACEEYLKETYGITVYQEQVMLLSQKLAGFSKGEADTLRKAMGKKKFDLLEKMRPQFLDQGEKNGHERKILEKIWRDWEAFASYAFNKSHSTCYAYIAYQTAYLKANYPAEYMASVLSNNMNDIKQVTFFMEECRRMGIQVLGPDINESIYKFTVNQNGAIRFGLGAIRGVGNAPVEAIENERALNGNFTNIFDLTRRINQQACNKRVLEALVLSGAFDSFTEMHRAQYFFEDSGKSFISTAIKFGSDYQEREKSNQQDLFVDINNEGSSTITIPTPPLPYCEKWSRIQELNREKEVVGIYISGHPLDDYKIDITSFCTGTIADIEQLEKNKGRSYLFAGIITDAEHRFTKKGDPFGTITIEDYNDSTKLFFFQEDYGKFKAFMNVGAFIYIEGGIQPKKWSKTNEFEFKVSKIDFLSNIRNYKTKFLKIQLPLKSITANLIDEFDQLFKNNQGKFPVKFNIQDQVNKMEIDMPSNYFKVNLSEEMLDELNKLQVEYSLEK